ncbi:efflux RND transporter permease subunit [Oceanisphaera avium]|uniref:MFS transporter n=1 Tax=Oceanisphaera avium TaxID=1903694 RepID=A0A1Y0CV57_9GAMM|nr:efflux RND transporter permease subunit [Oceanisphaera avium]ART79098.1 MFS transporter [Oceanisphaera avium]
MKGVIRGAVERSRATLMAFIFLLIGGAVAYQAIPKEANPDVTIPMMYVSLSLEGISPEDAERLLVRPMEQELRTLAGIKKMTSTASEGHASVMLEFDAGFDPKLALQDVREKVDTARNKIPQEADEPEVHEINVSLFPVLSVALSGPLSETELVMIARRLKDEIEGVSQVLEVDIGGDREDLLEIIVDPQVLDTYGIDYGVLFNLVSSNNRLVAAGSLDTGAGRLAIKVPGVIEDLDDVLGMPVKVNGDQVVTFADVATIRRSFKEPAGFARINDNPGVVLEVSKRAGANIIDTIEEVKALLEEAKPRLPSGVEIDYIMDQSHQVESLLADLLNNVVTAVVLVLILILLAMGLRSAVMVGLTIPGAFLSGILVIWAIGFTMNIIVLFGLILVAGMLVDGAIVVSELADRNLHEGQSPKQAWINAAQRMSWPVISSTATTLAVFVPLLFWPGVVGEFMKYLPATVIICLLASLVMALVFLPTMGSLAKARPPQEAVNVPGSAHYRSLLSWLLRRPLTSLLTTLLLVVVVYAGYAQFNHGVEFFPDIEPDSAQLQVRARGDLSVYEKDALLQQVEARLQNLSEVNAVYARSFAMSDGQMGSDVIGVLQFQFTDWFERRPVTAIKDTMLSLADDIPGIILDFRQQQMGPTSGKPVELRLRGLDDTALNNATVMLRNAMAELGGFSDVEDDRSLPGIEWRLTVDREAAARLGADVVSVGNAVQLVTNGLNLATFRPDDANDEVDIRIRLPASFRSFDQLSRLTLHTDRGQVPLSHFVSVAPAPKVGTLHRVNGKRTITLQADIVQGFQLDERLNALRLNVPALPEGVSLAVAGEDADQKEAGQFLIAAFGVALFLMTLILVIQFNSLYQTGLVLSAIIFSTAGVLLGLLLNGQSFGIVMVGMGIIALAGIVVNNNIVLIDTFNQLRQEGMSPHEAALETGCLRLRPVLLTAITTVLGLMPMVLGVNVDLIGLNLGLGAPSTQWWTQLSSAIAGGLVFATLLTLLLTPCMLVLGHKKAINSK